MKNKILVLSLIFSFAAFQNVYAAEAYSSAGNMNRPMYFNGRRMPFPNSRHYNRYNRFSNYPYTRWKNGAITGYTPPVYYNQGLYYPNNNYGYYNNGLAAKIDRFFNEKFGNNSERKSYNDFQALQNGIIPYENNTINLFDSGKNNEFYDGIFQGYGNIKSNASVTILD